MRVLFFDLETTGNDPSANQIVGIGLKEYMGPVHWAFIGEEVSEREALEAVRHLFDKADVIVGWNIKGFDLPFLLCRALYHNVDYSLMLRKVIIDMKEVVSKLFVTKWGRAPSMDAFIKWLGLKREVEFTGIDVPDLYLKAIKGDESAKEIIFKHCEDDLRLYEQFYERLKPYIQQI